MNYLRWKLQGMMAVILPPLLVDYLVVAGGGGGGSNLGGGGGAGGLIYVNAALLLPCTNYTVTVGAGGISLTTVEATSEGNSVFDLSTA